jgi:hypothetical protein
MSAGRALGAGELLPCPMCGTGPSSDEDATQVQIYWQVDGHSNVLCEECGAQGPERATYVEAIAAWNTRTPTPDSERAGGSEVVWNAALEEAAKVADGSFVANKEAEQRYLASANSADSTSGREVDLEYAVSSGRRANGDQAIAAAIRALKITARAPSDKLTPTPERAGGWQQDTVAFVQEWLMSGDHEPTQWDRDFAAAIDARAGGWQQEQASRMRAALQDIADAEPIPNDAVAFVWCRNVALAALTQPSGERP